MFIEFFKNAEKKKERKNIELMENKIYEIDKIIKNQLEKGIQLDNIKIENINKQQFANLVSHIISKDKVYLKLYINLVKYYLNKYTKYSNFKGDKEFFLKKLSMSMHPEKFPKDKIVIQKDEIGDKFYIILKGSVSIIIVQEVYDFLTQTEYDKYLESLNIYKEYSLIKLIFTYPNPIKGDQNILKSLHELEQLSSKSNVVINKNKEEKVSAKQFVERIEPKIDYSDTQERTRVKIAKYKIVANLKEGDTFGEIALSKNDNNERRRTATVITDTECVMGTVLNRVYSSFLKEIEEKNKLFLISQVLEHTLFREIAAENFLKYNYFNFFNSITYKGGEYLFKQGETRNAIFFINDGIVNIYTISSFEDLNNYIEYFKSEINKSNKTYKINQNDIIINEDFYINKEYQLQRETNPPFKKYYTKKKLINLYTINKKETLGYEDYLLEDDKYFASAKVNSQTCKVFVLEINFLNSLLKDRFILKNYIMTNYERKGIMLKRLRNIKNTFLDKFLENHKSNFLKINTIDIKKEKKETINYFKHSNTKISLKQNLKSKEYKFGISSEKDIFSIKIKKKNFGKKNKIFNTFNYKGKKSFTYDTFYSDKKSINDDKINKNKFLKNSISYDKKNENKKIEGFLPVLYRSKSMNKNNRKIIKNNYTYDNKISKENINNNLIDKISSLSNKYMINEYGNNKNKNKINKSKNMTQLDFLFYDYFFIERGNKNYSKEPLISDN